MSKHKKAINCNYNNKEIINNSSFSLNNEDSSQFLEFHSSNQLLNNNNFKSTKFIIIKRYIISLIILLILYLVILINFYKLSKIILFIDNKKMNKKNKIFNKDLIQKLKNNIKICICTFVKKEKRYIREFAQYYENYEIDQIILYINNDMNGEKIEDVIKDYINKGFIKMIDWRGKNKTMIQIWNDCYVNNFEKFDWFIFYDIDEYIYLQNYTSIKSFLNEPKFKNCNKIYLSMVIHKDNNLIYNSSLHTKFMEVELNSRNKKYYNESVKSIIRGHTPNRKINHTNIIYRDIKGCNGFGKEIDLNHFVQIKNADFEYYYINHYLNKSL